MNNKIIDITKLVVLFIILILLTFVFVDIIKGGSGIMSYEKSSPILNEEYAGVKKLECNMSSSELRVSEYDGEKVIVKAYSSGFPVTPAPSVSMTDGILKIQQINIISFGLFKRNTVEILVPRGSEFDYDLHTISGSLKLDAKSVNAALSSTSGSVKVYQGGKTLDLKCTSGSVKVYEPFVNARINCISGSIKSVCGEISENMDITCTSGSVRVKLYPADIGYVFNGDATSGSVKDEYRDSRFGNSGTSSQGDQKLSINVRTTSGSIKLADWND